MRRCASAPVLVALLLSLPCVHGLRGAEHTLVLTVVEAASRQPIADARLRLNGSCAGQQVTGDLRTDAAGRVDIYLPSNQARYVSIRVTKDGYVPMRGSWPAQPGSSGAPVVPADYCLALESATTIGGRVLDDAGQPIAGATVVLHVHAKSNPAKPNESLSVTYETVTTDATGGWSYTGVPGAFDAIDVGTYHTAYNSTGGNGFYPMKAFPAVEALRDGTALLTIPRGVPIEGVVLGAGGRPIAGASVGMGRDRVASNAMPVAKTGPDGRFRMAADAGTEVPLTAMAPGHAPDLKRIVLSQGEATVEFRLEPARTLKGRVVDADGKPLRGARLYVDTWRGCRTLDTNLSTNAEGRFEWKDAPADAVEVDVLLMGYADLRNLPLTASDEEITVVLQRPLQVTGTVVDAETGQPVDAFRVVRGMVWDDGRIAWERDPREPVAHGGRFEREISFPRPGYVLRIEADGYLPADSRTFRMAEGTVALEFRLTKGKGLAGVVRDREGRPVAGAKVALAIEGAGVYITSGMELRNQGAPTTETDAEGRYSLPAQSGPYAVVAFAAAGYAEAGADQLAQQPDITLTPWGRIEGTVQVSGRPGAGSEIAVWMSRPYDPNELQIYNHLQATADAEGHFAFERVCPGEVTVVRTHRVPQGGGMWANGATHRARATVRPGETTTVTLGGSGRPVVGRVAIPPAVAAAQPWLFSRCVLGTKTAWPRPEMPAGIATPEKLAEWRAAFLASDAGRKYQADLEAARRNHREFTLIMQNDGSFRADDVEPGTYELAIAITEAGETGVRKTLATVVQAVTVDPIPGGRSAEPLDLGTLTMTATK